ncbi:MAG TPA: hypothetical protein VND87_15515 [Stellaceae bacterium]|nr:hypothetical protein [Stellaceae bacterium]
MAVSEQPDIVTLQADVQTLRTDFAKLAADLREIAGSGIARAQTQAQDSADRVWSGVKRQAEQVGHEIEERPVMSALAAFGTGLILGMLLNSRRG